MDALEELATKQKLWQEQRITADVRIVDDREATRSYYETKRKALYNEIEGFNQLYGGRR